MSPPDTTAASFVPSAEEVTACQDHVIELEPTTRFVQVMP